MVSFNNSADHQVTQYNLITGGANNTLNNVAPSATSGVPAISQGSSSQPVFGTAVVAGGGTGQVTLTSHGVLVGAGTSAITQLAAGTAGQILQSGGASADPAYSTATYPATAGTSGNILTSNGTNFVSSAPASGSQVLISSQTASSSASISFTSGVTGYTYYLLMFFGVVLSNNNVQILLTASTNGGSTYLNSGYYVMGYQGSSNGTLPLGAFAQNNVSSFLIGTGLSNSSTGSTNSRIYLYNLASTTVNKIIDFTFSAQYQAATESYTATATGMVVNATAINALKLAPSAGTFSSGTFNLYGIA